MGQAFYSPSNERRNAERRRRRSGFVVRERRSGFDRRAYGRGAVAIGFEGMLRGLRDSPRMLLAVLVVVNALNLADFLLTMNVLAAGGGEANPIMRAFFEIGSAQAAAFKLGSVLGVSVLIWSCRRFRSVLRASLVALCILSLVFIYHIIGITLLV